MSLDMQPTLLPATLVTSAGGCAAESAPTSRPDSTLTVIAYGTPGPQGSKAFKGLTAAGNALLVESSKKVKPWRRAVMDAAAEATANTARWLGLDAWVPLDGPLEVEMVFTLRKPASAPKRRRTWPTRYPDLSKLARSTEDALTGIAWVDDARIVRYRDLAKVYPGEDPQALCAPGVVVRVYTVATPQTT